jgi:DNA-binding NtrC family response regulator
MDDVRSKRFRIDLFYRLNVVEIHIPPLRDRKEDIRPIAEAYTEKFSQRLKKGHVELTEDAISLLETYSWPGNIRELINMIERAVLLDTSRRITADDLPVHGSHEVEETKCSIRKEQETLSIDIPPEGIRLDDIERATIISALMKTGANVTHAARMLGVERGTLRYKMKKHGIDARSLKEKIKTGEYEPVSSTS